MIFELIREQILEELHRLNSLGVELDEVIKLKKLNPAFRNRLCADILEDFYLGVENIFKVVAEDIDQSLPSGEQWHKKLLRQMTIGTSLRPPLIQKEFGNELSDYLKFRHLKRNVYGFMLDMGKMGPLVEKLPQTLEQIKSSVRTFFELLAEMTSNKSQ
ncbi:MAG: hypothetical protein STSR0004_04300 [Peptococcaceae bacterium]